MKIAFQGVLGAYSHLAAQDIFPGAEYQGYETFAQALQSVVSEECDRAVIPVENLVAGRVADVHFLLSETGLYIVGEYYLRIRHQLWADKAATLADIRVAYSHPQALAQCSKFLASHRIKGIATEDTALSCRLVANRHQFREAAIASDAAGRLYGLKKVASDIENSSRNTTRFLVMSREAEPCPAAEEGYKTSLLFQTKNVPFALCRVLQCFATERLNLTKIESYLSGEDFVAARFYVEVEAAAQSRSLLQALASLKAVCENVRVLGSYAMAQIPQD